MKIIALNGQKGAGKGEVARFIRDFLHFHKLTTRIVGYGDVMKDRCYDVFNVSGLQDRAYYDMMREECEKVLPQLGITPRECWIRFAESMRAIDPLIWVKSMDDDLKHSKADVTIVHDLRKPVEYDALSNTKATMIRIIRPGIKVSTDLVDHELNDKIFHHQFINDCYGLEALRSKVYGFMKEIYVV